MGKISNEEYTLAKKQKSALLKLILGKTGVKHRDIVEDAERDFIRFNLDVVTPAERTMFDRLVF
jgi:hypothetical protein